MKNQLIKYLWTEKRLLFVLLADIFVFSGVVFLGWSPSKIVAFYFLEMCTLIFSYAIYHFIIKEAHDWVAIITACIGMCVFMGFFFIMIINLTGEFEINKDNYFELFYPYYEVPVFLTSVIGAQIYNTKKYLHMGKEEGKPAFSFVLAYNLLLVPFMLFFSLFLAFINPNTKFNLILSLIIFRNFIEYKRYKSFQSSLGNKNTIEPIKD